MGSLQQTWRDHICRYKIKRSCNWKRNNCVKKLILLRYTFTILMSNTWRKVRTWIYIHSCAPSTTKLVNLPCSSCHARHMRRHWILPFVFEVIRKVVIKLLQTIGSHKLFYVLSYHRHDFATTDQCRICKDEPRSSNRSSIDGEIENSLVKIWPHYDKFLLKLKHNKKWTIFERQESKRT